MKLKKVVIVAVLVVPTLGACGNPASKDVSSLQSESKSKGSQDKKTLFKLSDYLAESKYYGKLEHYLKNGDIIFGDMKKMGVRSNAIVETTGASELTPNGSRNISARYYLMGAIYPDGIKMPNGSIFSAKGVTTSTGEFIANPFNDESNDVEHSIFEIKAKAGFDVKGVEGEVRMLGNSVYALDNKLEYSQSFTRKLELSYPLFPGGSVKGAIGGELGFNIKAVVREDDAASLYFQPNVKVQASVAPTIKALIASFKVVGALTLVDTTVSTSVNLKYLPAVDFIYGTIGMDGGIYKMLDGSLKFVFEAGLKTFFEEALSLIPIPDLGKYWNKVSDFLGINLSLSWEYMIWDPKPIVVGEIDPKDIFFTSDMSSMSSSECRAARDQVYADGDKMEAIAKKASGLDAKIAHTAQANLASTALYINGNCGK